MVRTLTKYGNITLYRSEVKVLEDLEDLLNRPIPDITNQSMAVFGYIHKSYRITELRLFISFFQHDFQLNKLPQSICNLEALETLDVSHNQLSQFPKDFFNLESLEKLYVDYNNFTKFPEVVTKLPNITQLNFDENQLQILPKSVNNLTYLQSLQLAGNLLTRIPVHLSELNYLKRLVLNRNLINQLDYTLLEQFSKLYVLDLRSNPIPENQINKTFALLRLTGKKLGKFYLKGKLSDYEHPFSIKNILTRLQTDPMIDPTKVDDFESMALGLKNQYDLHHQMYIKDEVINLANY